MKITPNYKEIDVDVDFDYEPEEPMIWTHRNGDPGEPGSTEQYHVTSVKHNGIEIIDYLSDQLLEEIEDKLRTENVDNETDAMISRYEDKMADREMDRRFEP